MELRKLGPYRIERTEDYDGAEDKSYAEMIRVKGSGVEKPSFMVVSHLYKYSETELALFLKDKKNLWRALGKLLNEDIDITDEEIILRFPVEMFSKVASMVPLVKKRGQVNLSEDEKKERATRLNVARKNTSKIEQIDPLSSTKERGGNIRHTITVKLENFVENGIYA
ncbi:MAG: hypothetical protein M1162_00790 [Candidatus Thermoplasmatota archaeon]|nr:hypothetical protein [Candidatus Thermoplasmatota archaeon]